MSTAAAWIDPAPRPPPRRMRVAVLLECGARTEYEALFRHTFDAYDDALQRHPSASRIEVADAAAQAARCAAAPTARGAQP